jgi:choline kinase
MKIIIPMAGTGDRFVMKNYIDPKPLIEVNGKRIISYIYEMFDKNDEFVFICNETHLKTTKMREIIKTADAIAVKIIKLDFAPISGMLTSLD